MSENDLDAKQIEKQVSDLAEAMERVRDDKANRDDVVVEMKQASQARLELLAQALQPVFQEIPEDNDQFEFALTNGENARLWIDMTSFVRMGRDRRVFEFIKDTRMGRTMLGETVERDTMVKIVTNYVAERLIEREQMIEGEWVSMRNYDFGIEDEAPSSDQESEKSNKNGWAILGWFALGLLGAAAAMIAWAWFGDIPAFIDSLR